MGRMMEKAMIILLGLASFTYASKMCKDDGDCADLGDVFCMKSRCDWGLCGCPRGKAMRFLGSEKKFQCVPIRRVGESCSTDGDAGVCGAKNSKCIDGSCQCDNKMGLYSYWGGELCDTQTKSISGETCSASLGSCSLSGTPPTSSCKKGDAWWTNDIVDSPLDTLPNTCGCAEGYRVALENDFEDHTFTGKYFPTCVPIKFDELCLIDGDCQGPQTGMECRDNKCACKTAGYVPDFAGTNCGTRLNLNDVCYPSIATIAFDSVCNGQEGLVCGNVCEFQNSTLKRTCQCDASWKSTDSGCTKVKEGSNCQFDYECKSLSRTAVCVEQSCKAGVGMTIGSLFTILVTVMFTLLGVSWE